uniref:Reverse transcriptase domain-containing protein n=1 Tax=Tanacetum cinerariifolium TaxID=118510 RepID=A0A6L2LW99_TANCI|nr:hypothetical protein [Tanacetum cinerariifolium]
MKGYDEAFSSLSQRKHNKHKDKIICDLDKTPDLSQRSPQNYPNLLDSSEPSNDNTNVANALQEPFVVNQDPGKNFSQSPLQINHHCCYGCGDPLEDIFCHQCTYELCGNGAHYGYNCPPKVPIIPDPKPFNNQTIKELPQTLPSFDPTCYSEDGNSFTYDSTSNLVHDSPNIFNTPSQLPLYSCEFYGNDARYGTIVHLKFRLSIRNRVTIKTLIFRKIFMIFNNNIFFVKIEGLLMKPTNEPDNSLSIGDEHLDTILATESDEFIKSSVENLVSNPNIPKKIYSNPLFDEEIISMKIDPHHFNAESDLIESLLNRDSSIISSLKIDSLFYEFAGELTLLKSIPPKINETDCDLEEETHFIKRFFDSLMEEIDLSFTPDDPMSLGIEEDDYDSEKDILILEELLSNDSLSLPENESFHFDIPSSSRPPAKPPDGNLRILNLKMMGDISEHKVPMPRLMSTFVPNQEKSPNLLPHLGHEAFQLSPECPMMIYGKNTPILDVLFFHFYPLDQFKYGGFGSS